MKKIFLVVLFTIFSINVFATDYQKEYESPLTVYKENYFIAGDNDNQVKFQFSLKFNLLYPSSTGIYFAYTQRSLWYLYDKSSPFVETNYMPEVFYRLESKNNLFGDTNLGIIDYIQISPISHMSNGRDGLESRSINTYYGQIQLSAGDVYNFGVNVKVFNYWNIASDNKDIDEYIGYYETDLFFKLKSKNVEFLDKEELHFKFGGFSKKDYDDWRDSDKNKKALGWYSVEAQFRILTTVIQPYFFIQWYHGYAQWMVNYTEKEKSLRAGFLLK